jgi:hypothetical protein
LFVNDPGDRSFLTKRPFLDRVFNALRKSVDEWGLSGNAALAHRLNLFTLNNFENSDCIVIS